MKALFVAAMMLLWTGCGEPDCEFQSDCDRDQVCIEGVCHNSHIRDRPPPVQTTFDGGPDTGVVDAGDGGPGPDGGMGMDAGNMGMDAGMPGPDSGLSPPDATPTIEPSAGDFAMVWLGEVFDSPTTSDYHAVAYLQNLDNATFESSAASHPDTEGSGCGVWTRRFTGGTIAEYEASSIWIIPGPSITVALFPQGGGVFERMQDPPQRMFTDSDVASIQFYTTGNANSVMTQSTNVATPPFVLDHKGFRVGTELNVRNLELRWEPSAINDTGAITVELADATREVIVSCLVIDDSRYTIPTAALDDFASRNPTGPYSLEIRYDRESPMPADLESSAQISILYRTSMGIRYPAVLQ